MRYALLSLFIFSLFSCSLEGTDNFLVITAYNAYAFFDDYEDGDEFDGFSRHDGYDGEAYRERVRSLAVLIGKECSSSDLIILSEIESSRVLSSLLEAGLDEKGFRYFGIAEGADSIAVGFISRIKPLRVAVHDSPGCRPILEIVIRKNDENIHVFGVHFRSRLSGGDEERMMQARHLASLMERNAGSLCIAAGDFNTDPHLSQPPFSLFPENYSEDNAFHVTGDPSKTGPYIYFSPLNDPDATLDEEGTYFHEGTWYCYDLLLLSEEAWDGRGLEYEDIEIVSSRTMKDMGGRPYPYDVSTGYGYSDHFPVTLRMKAE